MRFGATCAVFATKVGKGRGGVKPCVPIPVATKEINYRLDHLIARQIPIGFDHECKELVGEHRNRVSFWVSNKVIVSQFLYD